MERNTEARQSLLVNTASNALGKVIGLGVGFLLTPLILGRVGATSYGIWILATSVVSYGWLLDLGISGAVIRYTAAYHATGDRERFGALVVTALAVYSALGLFAIMGSAILAPLFPQLVHVPLDQRSTTSWIVFLAGLGLGLSLPCATSAAVLRGLQRFDFVNLLAIGNSLLYAGAAVVVLRLGGGIVSLVAVGIPLTLLMQIPAVWLIHRSAPELRLARDGIRRSVMATILTYSWANLLIEVGSRFQSKTDEIVIGAVLAVGLVTPYSLALRLSQLPQLVANQFVDLLLPLSAGLHAEDDWARLRTVYLASSRITLAVVLPMASIVILLSGSILTLWVGAGYRNYALLVVILTVAGAIETSLLPAGAILQGMARQRLFAITSVLNGVVNLLLSVVLARYLGLTGVALATLIPMTVETFAIVLPYSLHTLGIGITVLWRDVIRPTGLPVVPTVLALLLARRVAGEPSILAVGISAVLALAVYLALYLSSTATRWERELWFGLATSAVAFVRMRSP